VAFLIEGHIPAVKAVLTKPYLLRAGAITGRRPDMEHEELAFSHLVPDGRTMRYSAAGNICVFHTNVPSPRELFCQMRGEEFPAPKEICYPSVTGMPFVNWIHIKNSVLSSPGKADLTALPSDMSATLGGDRDLVEG
jgi:hypothetical protein